MKRFIACLLLCCPSLIVAANDFQFYSSSSQSSASARLGAGGLNLDLVRNPLADSLNLIADTYRVTVLVDSEAMGRLQTPVSARGKDLTLASALEMMLKPAKLHCLVDTTRGVIVTAKPMTLDEAATCKLISLRSVAIRNALRKRVPLMLFHTPLEMGLQMAEGFAGITIEIDRAALRQAGISMHQMVSVQSGNQTLAESLDTMLSPLGLRYVIGEQGIVVTTKVVQPTTVGLQDRV